MFKISSEGSYDHSLVKQHVEIRRRANVFRAPCCLLKDVMLVLKELTLAQQGHYQNTCSKDKLQQMQLQRCSGLLHLPACSPCSAAAESWRRDWVKEDRNNSWEKRPRAAIFLSERRADTGRNLKRRHADRACAYLTLANCGHWVGEKLFK